MFLISFFLISIILDHTTIVPSGSLNPHVFDENFSREASWRAMRLPKLSPVSVIEFHISQHSQDESGNVFLSNPTVQDRVRNQKVSPVRDISQNRSTCETAPAATSPAATVPAATFSRSKDLVRNLEKETPEVDAEAPQELTLSTGSRLASLIESAHKQREFVVLEEFVANNGMPATKVRTKWRTYCVTTSPETGKKIGLPCPTRITKRR